MGFQPASIARAFPQRIGILIDVQNMFYSAKLLHQSKVDYGRLLREITGTRQLVRALAYIVQKPDVNQSGFHEALTRFGYELKIKELKIRPDPDGRGGTVAKGSWDVGMTIDALMMAPKLDTIVMVTGDGDYVPLVETLKSQGCRVEVVSFERSTAGELIKAADQYIPIQESWIFKEKKFEHQPGSAPQGQQQQTTGNGGVLGSTAPGQTVYEGLPKDEELDAESAAVEAQGAGTYDPDATDEDESDSAQQADSSEQEAEESTDKPSDKKSDKSPDLGILA